MYVCKLKCSDPLCRHAVRRCDVMSGNLCWCDVIWRWAGRIVLTNAYKQSSWWFPAAAAYLLQLIHKVTNKKFVRKNNKNLTYLSFKIKRDPSIIGHRATYNDSGLCSWKYGCDLRNWKRMAERFTGSQIDRVASTHVHCYKPTNMNDIVQAISDQAGS